MQYISYIIIGILVLIYFSWFNFYNTNSEIVNYMARPFYHANVNHLFANVISLYSLSFIEDIIGKPQFIFAMLFIWVVSSILLYLIHIVLPSRKVYTVGFSGVIFGLIVIYYSLMNQSTYLTLTGLIVSILPQIFVKGISFEGHLAGIIAGIIYILIFRPKNLITVVSQ